MADSKVVVLADKQKTRRAKRKTGFQMVEMGGLEPPTLTCEEQKTDPAEQNRTAKAASDERRCLISFAPVLDDADQIGGTMAEYWGCVYGR